MIAFTPGERRAILVLAGLLALGAAHDWWSATRLRAGPPTPAGPGTGAAATARAAEPSPAPAADSTTVRSAADAPVVDLNRAGPEQLDALPGIGPVLAARIVEFRRRHGPFRSVEELRAVRGVGPRLLERLRPRVAVGGPRERAGEPGG